MSHTTARFALTLGTLAALGLVNVRPAAAQAPAAGSTPPAPLRLALPDVIDRALRTSHRIGEVEAREDAARAVVAATSAADMPLMSLLGGYMRTNHVDEFAIAIPGTPPRVIYPDVPDNWRVRLDLQWPVYTGGRVGALERASRADLDAAGRDIVTMRVDTRLDAIRAFWTLVTAGEAVKVVEEALNLVDAHLRDVRTMREVGLVAPNDVLSAEAQRSREQVLLIEARNGRNVAEADLRRATAIASDVPIEIDAQLDGPRPHIPAYDALLAEAMASRPERQALQLRIDAIGERRTAAAAGLKPTIGVGAGFDYARPNPRLFPRAGEWNDSWDAGISVAWPLWDGGRVKADVALVSANRRAAEQRLAEFDRTLEFEVRQRRLDLEAASAAISASTDGVASATEARRVVAERFKAGLTSNTEVLDAQQAFLVARLELTRALAGVRLAQARLDRAVGR